MRPPVLVLIDLLAAVAPTRWSQQAKEPATSSWRGPIQSVLKIVKGEIPDAHSVVEGVIKIGAEGKLRLASKRLAAPPLTG